MDQDHHPQYGVPELRQLMKGERRTTTTSPSTSSHFPSDFFGFNLAPAPPPPHRLLQFTTDHEMGFLPRGIHGLGGGSSTAGHNSNLNASTSGGGVGFSGFLDGGGFAGGGGVDGGGTGRWPRQETLTLLEIRSRLDHKFKEANQKGPLWDEVSRFASLILSRFYPNFYLSLSLFILRFIVIKKHFFLKKLCMFLKSIHTTRVLIRRLCLLVFSFFSR